MQVAIFGARDGEHVAEYLEKENINVKYLTDNVSEKWGTCITTKFGQELKIISPEELQQKYFFGEIDKVLVAVRNVYNRWSIVEQLQKLKIRRIGLVKPSVLTYRWPIVLKNKDGLEAKQIWWLDQVKKPLIYYLEVHAADACNLNCKGCLHFSSLYNKNEIPDKSQMEKLIEDIQYLSMKCDIFHLRVLGGEPLLNKNLGWFLQNLRKALPDTDIGVVTNGILIPLQESKLFEIMHDNEIGFNITLYPPTHGMKDVIYSILDKYKVSYGSHLAQIDEFSKGLKLEPTKGKVDSHTKCVSKNCFFLREGKLYKCALEILVNRFYKVYNIPLEFDTGVNIYDEWLEWEKVIKNMYEHPVSLCRYCSDTLVNFEWGIANPPQKEDWLV